MGLSEPTYPFSADRPIGSRSQDLLGRSSFAGSLAKAIQGWTGKDSLVIALYGSWGTGKSSVKNLVLEALREPEDRRPVIVEFNPWQWAGREQLVAAFFGEIGLKLGRADKSGAAKKRAKRWRAYAAYLKATSAAVEGLQNAAFWPLVMAWIVGIGASFAADGWTKVALGVVSFVILLIGVMAKIGVPVAENLAAAVEARIEASQLGLQERKDELAGLMRGLKKPVIVVIDDIDRLASPEVALLLQLVKANADFPNVVYLLLFQRESVESSLEAALSIDGRGFLEKIVQVGFDIPRIERTRLEKVLYSGLDELLDEKAVNQRFDQERWANLFVLGLRSYFQTLRDVNRFLSSLSFHVSLFRNSDSFEVNPVDLIALEVLRVFEPELYLRIPEAKSVLTGQAATSAKYHGQTEEARLVVNSLIDRTAEAKRPWVREIIKQLFPPCESALGGPSYLSWDDRWYRELRICHSAVFDRYFTLAIPEGDISQVEIDKISALLDDRAGLVAQLRALNGRGLLSVVLDRLESYKQTIDLKHAVPFVTALLDIGDELPERLPGLFDIGAGMRATRIIFWYLKQEKDSVWRGRVLVQAMRATTGLHLPVMTTSLEDRKQEKDASPDSFLIEPDVLHELQSICLEKIRLAANDGTLEMHPELAYILYRWREWSSPDEPRAWVANLVESDSGLVSFLRAALRRSTSCRNAYQFSKYTINLSFIEDFVALDVVTEKARQLTHDSLSAEERGPVDALQRALKLRQEGKSEDDLLGEYNGHGLGYTEF